MQVLGPVQLMEDVISKGLCVGCGACVDLCPYFVNYKGKTAQVHPCTLETGRCHAFCPKAEVDLHELSHFVFDEPYRGSPMGSYRRVVKSRAKKDGLFQTGGTVTALISQALESGMIDAAVLTDREGMKPVPRIVTDPAEVAACATSKYTAAPTLAAVNEAVRQGFKKIGVVGTPCQMTALAMMRQNPTDRPDFTDNIALAVGLFCTWAVDARDFTALVEQEMGLSAFRKMDMPPPPSQVLIVETGAEEVEIPLERVRELVPAGCGICPDMTSEWADVSVGIVEGETDWNTLVIRTDAGEQIVAQAGQSGALETDRVPEDKLKHLMAASNNKKKRALAALEEQELVAAPGDEQKAALRIKGEVRARIET